MDSATIRSSVLANAVASLGAIEGVDAIYLSGSLAEKTEDAYSDIDLRVVVAVAAYDSVLAMREHLPTTWGPFLFHETVNANLTVSYYESLTKADVFYFTADTVVPSPWFNIGTQVLLDRSGRLGETIAASRGLAFVAQTGEIATHLQKCLAGLIESAKRVRRNEPIYAARLCAEAVNHLLIVEDLLCGRAPLGSSKRERLAPGSLTQVATSSIGIPTMMDSASYFSRLAVCLRMLIPQSEKEAHCSHGLATRLLAAVEQMVLLAGAGTTTDGNA
jgi:predicted nucleotidyltransferase